LAFIVANFHPLRIGLLASRSLLLGLID